MSAHVCFECGNAPTIHIIEKLSAFVDTAIEPWFRPLDALRRAIEPWFTPALDTLLLYLMGFCSAIRIGKFLEKPDYRTPSRARCLWDAAPRRGIRMYEFRLFGRPLDTYLAHRGGKTIMFDGLPRPGTRSSESLDWMDNKAAIHERFTAAGIPMARGGVARTAAEALAIFRRIPHPVIVKPNLGSRARHTTIHITDEAGLIKAFWVAKKLSRWAMVEEELRGRLYRTTVIGGRVAGVVRRDQAHVIGTGHLSIRALVEIENKNPLRHGPIFHTIPVNTEVTNYLHQQGLSWESIPRAGQYVELGMKASRGAGGSTKDVTDVTHPDNLALFEKIGRVLDDPLVGIDFMTPDIRQSWRDQDACGVIECNSCPFIDLHQYPIEGAPRDAAGMLWDFVFQ